VEVIEEDLGWKKILKNLEKLDGAETEAGIFGSGSESPYDEAAIAGAQELGAPRRNIPQRPFTRNAFDANLSKMENHIQKEYVSMLEGRLSPRALVARTGEKMADYIVRSILTGTFIPLSPGTILAKGSSKPLVDKGIMKGAVTHKENM
jgi:hypothetical protein